MRRDGADAERQRGGATGTAEGAVRETSVGRYHDGKAQKRVSSSVFFSLSLSVCVCVCVYPCVI